MCCLFFQVECCIRDAHYLLEFRRVLVRSPALWMAEVRLFVWWYVLICFGSAWLCWWKEDMLGVWVWLVWLTCLVCACLRVLCSGLLLSFSNADDNVGTTNFRNINCSSRTTGTRSCCGRPSARWLATMHRPHRKNVLFQHRHTLVAVDEANRARAEAGGGRREQPRRR